MTTVRVYRCHCGGTPDVKVTQVCEDLMEAQASCSQCGQEADPIEHVWGGEEARVMAYEEWNDMRRDQARKAAV